MGIPSIKIVESEENEKEKILSHGNIHSIRKDIDGIIKRVKEIQLSTPDSRQNDLAYQRTIEHAIVGLIEAKMWLGEYIVL